jgi:PAS domain S-box-containing protein
VPTNPDGQEAGPQRAGVALQDQQREWLRVTLSSISDAVITTDAGGGVTFLNPVAQSLTGWTQAEASGVPLETVFRIANEGGRIAVEGPAVRAWGDGVVGVAKHTLLTSRDGTERPIDESAAPIRNERGDVAGVVLVFRDVTERRSHERTVQHALAYAEEIIATLREPFVVLDKGLKVKTANDAFYRAFHVSKKETEGRFIYDLGNGQWDIPRLRRLLKKDASVQDFEVEHDFPTIGPRSMMLNARHFPPDGDNPNLVLLAIEDVTERRRGERTARDALAYAEEIIATLGEPFVVLDRSLKVKSANASFYRTFHVSRGETEGRFIHDLGNGQWDIPRLRSLLEEALPKKRIVQDFEVEHDFPAIGRRIMLLGARRFPLHGDHPGLILLAIEDATTRRRAEATVKGSELRYRRLFQTAKDGILILDAGTGKIIDANPFMCGLLGYERGDFLGKELWEIGLFEDIEASRAAYGELKEKGYIRYEHLPLRTEDGREVEVEFVSNVYKVDHRRIAQCNIRDITERSRLERQAQEQARALAGLHRRKDEFLAMLSHELRNPLAAIHNAVHLLGLGEGDDPVQQKARGVIERQVGQLSHLINDLLDVSRITNGQVRLREERLDMRGVVERAVESARPLIDGRRHTLTATVPAEPVWMHADPTRLEQVVVNLLNNAAKYTDEGGRIRLTLLQLGNEMVLSVRDTGVGIDLEQFPDIFDLFTQADRSLDRSQGGLGIGLSLVRRLVEMHRGTVEVHSGGLGLGSEFTVMLPLLPAPAPIPPPTPNGPAGPPAQVGRVLVVDDNVDSAETLTTLLKMSGHDVRTAFTGPTALDLAVAFLPDVVLLDIGLPELNGYEVARRLRELPPLKRSSRF